MPKPKEVSISASVTFYFDPEKMETNDPADEARRVIERMLENLQHTYRKQSVRMLYSIED